MDWKLLMNSKFNEFNDLILMGDSWSIFDLRIVHWSLNSLRPRKKHFFHDLGRDDMGHRGEKLGVSHVEFGWLVRSEGEVVKVFFDIVVILFFEDIVEFLQVSDGLGHEVSDGAFFEGEREN